ncbi:MAG: glutamate--tRNA ligase [Cytophagales bacterium]|nr:glutamate--tRNA ligase [Armatimonadota bacterium]
MTSHDLTAPTRRVRTRFAPSPTGFLHIGAFRTALFSFLLARRFGGDFILRIEDTDQARLVTNSLADIIGSLLALGIGYDEGPDKASVAALDAEKYGVVDPALLPDHGGDYGPYFQSQRLPRYRELLDQLLEEGKAYYAFETKEDLDRMRKAADIRKEPFRYNGKYRNYPLGEARDRVAGGESAVIRFKMPTDGPIRTVDALRGETVWDARTQDDFVILKGDGFPPYHFSSMVDDHDMAISHILRSEEWISSTPKHVCLFDAFGWEPPIFVHTPNVLGNDRKKLSKRTGAPPVKGTIYKPNGEPVIGLLDQGYLEDAVFNYLSITGWSPGDDTEVMTREEITRRFNLEGISASPALFDRDKLTWLNGVYLRHLSPAALVERALPYLIAAKLLPADPTPSERTYAASVIVLEQERLKTLDEIPGLTDFFFYPLPEYADKSVAKWLKKVGVAEYLTDVAVALGEVENWDAETVETATRGAGEKHGREKGDLTHPVRVAVTGREVGPSLFDAMGAMGSERVLARLAHAVEIARG